LTRASIKKDFFLKVMDCRVKPGNDDRDSIRAEAAFASMAPHYCR